jgi:hypothetical protein
VQNAYYDGAFKYKTTYGATFYQQTNSTHIWYNAPSGTAGNAITFTQAMTLDADGDLGIGTTSPAVKLHASTSGAGIQEVEWLNNSQAVGSDVGSAMVFTGTSSNNGLARITGAFSGATTADGGYMAFSTRAVTSGTLTERLRLDAAGNLGLGITPSAFASSSRAFQISSVTSISQQSNGSANVMCNAYEGGSNTFNYVVSAGAMRYNQNASSGHTWHTAPSGTAGNTITFTQAMTLDASGRLLISAGATAPNDASGFWLTNQSGIGPTLSGLNITFQTGGTGSQSERARIDSSGNLLVGTTSVTNSPAQGVQLANGSSIGGVFVGHADGTATGNYYATFSYNAGIIGSITQNGVSQVLYNISSDQRLKENIQDADSASSLIDALQVRQFDWKADGSHQRYGFVAQELVSVAPEAVHQPANPEDMMAVDYSKLVPMLVKEIQSLRKRLADAGI